MAPIDWAIVTLLLFSTVAALLRGFLLEIFSLAGLIVGAFVAGWQYDNFSPLLLHVGLGKNAADAVAFLLIAFGVAILATLLGWLLRGVIRGVGLGWVDRLLGAAFGFLRGAVVVVIAAMVTTAFFPHRVWMQNSRLLPYLIQASNPVEQLFPATLRDKLNAGRVWIDPAYKPAR
jgi:membrane protein required for colicin V production